MCNILSVYFLAALIYSCGCLGLLKILPLPTIFAIFAFATCGGFQGETVLLVSCQGMENKTVTAAFAYPFSAPDPNFYGGTWTDVYLEGNFSSAQFFVTLAVLVFLYRIAALVVYIGYKHVYNQNRRFPLTDLVITVITAFLWLVRTESCKAPGTTCHFAAVTIMGALNMSVVCMALFYYCMCCFVLKLLYVLSVIQAL
uniref:Synaptophysin like 1 n=1 Tax=Amazona collaria TaxID=241587 RepID=A0A8B9ISG7_9PSIT